MSSQQYLQQITLRGYKSIRELRNFRLNAGLNVLIGANGSGKTNFIRFFEMLSHMMDPARGLQNYVRERGGADAFLFRGAKITPEMGAHLRFGANEYKFALRAADDLSLFFAHESAPFYYHRLNENDQGQGHLESKLAYPNGKRKSEQWTVDTIRNWRVYHFHDTSRFAPIMGRVNSHDQTPLHSNAANLAPFLIYLQKNYAQHYYLVVETVRMVAPFFGDFVLTEVAAGQTQLRWRDRYSELVYSPSQLSDGTLRFICLAALLLQPNPPATIIIDEPELGLHPAAVRLLVSLLYGAAENCQLIVSTQSSLLINELEPEEIIVANTQAGETILVRLDADQLETWLEDYTIGQLWEKNVLGGLP